MPALPQAIGKTLGVQMTTEQTVHNTLPTEAEGQGRVLKFRRAMKCENGHLFFVVFKLDGFSCGPMEHVRPKECNGCNLWGAQPVGSNQQFIREMVNRQDLFEGDIYESPNGRCWIAKHGAFIYEQPGQKIAAYGWYLRPVDSDLPAIQLPSILNGKIIGNIHEHPELLESK